MERDAFPASRAEGAMRTTSEIRGISNGFGAFAVAALVALCVACGDDDAVPPVDGGASDFGADLGSDARPPDLGSDLPGCFDDDGDGVASAACGGSDCDDADPTRYPGATEVCDGDDEDCDDATLGPDGDGDGAPYFGCCDASGACGTDCDDTRSAVNVAAPETCNGLDDDCDGTVDEGVLLVSCFDADGDGRGAAGMTTEGCDLPARATTTCNDCDDGDASRYLGAFERCNGSDDDCDGVIDEDCECLTGATRACGSTVGACSEGVQRCLGTPSFWEATCAGATSPTPEVCNGVDDDCDGATDEGVATTFYPDCDLDGSGANGEGVTSCARPTTVPEGCTRAVWVTDDADCDDADPLRNGRVGCDVLPDGGAPDLGVDAGGVDLGAPDLGFDAGPDDLGFDAGPPDLGFDAGSPDLGTPDLGVDAGPADLGTPDLGCTSSPEICNAADDDCDGFIDDISPDLASLTVSCGSLLPAFVASTTAYRAQAPAGTTSCVVTAEVGCAAHTLTIDGAPAGSGIGRTVPFTRVAQPVTVTVTAPGGATRSYVVLLTRANTYFKASNTGANDEFGGAVALSADGSTLAVSAVGEDSAATGIAGDQASNAASASGAVYVFRRSGIAWAQEAYVKASNTGLNDAFGYALALSADGSVLAVGANRESSNATGINGLQANNDAGSSGAVYVFRRSSDVWAQEAYVKASNTAMLDYFGAALALSGDGTTLAVGAYGEDSAATGVGGDQMSNAVADSGAVYVFRNTTGAWMQDAYVKASNTGMTDYFGISVALSADGATMAVGASYEDSGATGVGGDQASNSATEAGAVYVFGRAAGAWTQSAYVKASNTLAFQHFGTSLALSADGATLAVGAYGEGTSGAASGAAYVFRWTAGVWAEQARLKASNAAASDNLGRDIALSADGTTLAAGAYFEDSAATDIGGDESSNAAMDAGAVYVFRTTGSTWTQVAYVKASNTNSGDRFGFSVALSNDGGTLAVGANYEDSAATAIGGDQTDNAAMNAGAVYLFY
jgi:hypothetical protein